MILISASGMRPMVTTTTTTFLPAWPNN
jgi:hypothetical protein